MKSLLKFLIKSLMESNEIPDEISNEIPNEIVNQIPMEILWKIEIPTLSTNCRYQWNSGEIQKVTFIHYPTSSVLIKNTNLCQWSHVEQNFK